MRPRGNTLLSATALSGTAAAVVLTALATLFALGMGPERLAETDVVLIYFVVITFAAFRFGRGASVVAAGLAVAAFDFFFVAPLHTVAVHQPRHLLTASGASPRALLMIL